VSSTPKRVQALFNQLVHAPRITFPEKRKPIDAPSKQGVYVIYSPNDQVVHVGATPRAKKGLAQRLRNHLYTQSSFTAKYKALKGDGAKLRKKYQFQYLVVKNRRQRIYLEALAIGRLCPAHIGIYEIPG